MKKLLISALLSSALAIPAFAALKMGEKAPDFSAKASLAGKEFGFSLKDALKKGPVVVYFYPSAYTQGCNIQAHTFAEEKEKFDAAGATIIGVSQDSIARLNLFSADPEYCAARCSPWCPTCAVSRTPWRPARARSRSPSRPPRRTA